MSTSPRATRTAEGIATMELHRLAEHGLIHRAERNAHGWWAIPAVGETPLPFYSADAVMEYINATKLSAGLTI